MMLPIVQAMILVMLWLWIGHRILKRSVEIGDAPLAMLLFGAALLRLMVAIVNAFYGPLPGAEVDAVAYDRLAAVLAQDYAATGEFTFHIGRFGYSSLVGGLYVLSGPNFLIPTTVNLVFVTEFLLLVHRLAVRWGGVDAGRLAVAIAAFYPTTVLYTAVPLRESVLLWGIALLVTGLVAYHEDEGALLSPRTLLAFAVLILLHDGFAAALFLLPATVWLKYDHRPVWQRTFVLGLTLLAMGAVFWNLGGMFRKLPNDPLLLLDPAFLAEIRAWKTSYGVGYGQIEPTWPGVFKAIPLLVFAFLAAPFPVWMEGPGDIPKMVEGLATLLLSLAGIMAVVTSRDPKFRRRGLLMIAIFGFFVLLFAVGTGNTGLAARHRAKFVWMPALLLAVRWWQTVPKPRVEAATRRPLASGGSAGAGP